MAKTTDNTKGPRLRRVSPGREAPNRSGRDHILRQAKSPKDRVRDDPSKRRKSSVTDTVQQAINDVVQLSSTVIEEQIRAGQIAAERLRDGIANSKQLNADVNMLVENLVATTKDVGATWLDLLSIVVRSIGSRPPSSEQPRSSALSEGLGAMRAQASTATRSGAQASTTTRTGASGNATTISSITPADPASPGVPPEIIVKGVRVRSVVLDLRPSSIRFVPVVRSLLASDPNHGLPAVNFELSADQTHLVLTVNVPRDQRPGTYSGIIVDSGTNEAGGTVSVVVDS